ncbi:MAG: hypothetical protein FJW34_23020 [Acidobacteria bacterium]|nr:hypothetical protein [Acidobacteriota bacterium]
MLFTLEALQANEGDCLILHYGEAGDPRFIVIDGGPGDTYKSFLGPRLGALKDRWSPSRPLSIEMLMVSHIDRDHIDGVLDWTGKMIEGQGPACDINTLWHNSFDDLAGNDPNGLLAALAPGPEAVLPAGIELEPHTRLVLAGVKEGRTLRDNAKKLRLLVNTGFKRLVRAPERGRKTLKWGDGLELTVVCPRKDRLARLQQDWDKKLEELRQKRESAAGAALAEVEHQELIEAAAYLDRSVYNLASMVVLAEAGGRRMLLTGDGRGDDILDGLDNAGLLDNGKIHVDLLKVPHHGSDRNTKLEFFQQITADHYVISADGKHGNPESETLKWIFEARGQAPFTLWLTNREGKQELGPRLRAFVAAKRATHPHAKVRFREDDLPSLKVNLLEEVTY